MVKKNVNSENIVLFPGMAGLTRDIVAQMKAKGAELLSVDIMVTQRCNFRCVYCYAEGGPERTNHLTMAKAKEIAYDAKELGVKIINMQGGEPLIWAPRDWNNSKEQAFFHFLKYIKKLFVKDNTPLNIVSFTDVAVIDALKARKLFKLGISLCCKLDSLRQEIQDELLGVKGGYVKMMQGFKYLIEAGYGKLGSPPLSTNTVVTALNYDDVPEVFRWSRRHNFKPFVIPVHMHGAARRHSEAMLLGKANRGTLNSQDIKKLFEELSEIDAKEFGIYWRAESPWVENKACSRHLGGVHIRADGMVLPCSEAPDFWALGNIWQDDFKKIVASDKIKKFRDIYSQLHENSKCSPNNCPLSKKNLCYGCRTRAYDDSGFDKNGVFSAVHLDAEGFFSGDPACWRK